MYSLYVMYLDPYSGFKRVLYVVMYCREKRQKGYRKV